MIVCIDPGHGGQDPGAVANGIVEKEVNLTVALLAKQMLEAHGHEVALTRRSDTYFSHSARAEIASKAKADLYISIHHNASGNTSARGLEIYHSIAGGMGAGLAEFIHQRYTVLIPELPTRGIRTRAQSDGRDYYAVIRLTAMPAIIIEGGFLTNTNDAKLIKQQHFQERQAQAISQGVVLWRGGSIMPEVPEWKKDGLRWLEENGLIMPDRWQAQDMVDIGTLGAILSNLTITGRRGDK
jgi:N-acetylmuramoyl-L-alanine amidase